MRRPKAKAAKKSKTATKKKATKKATKKAPRRAKAKKAARKTVARFEADIAGGALGCCTLSGNGPNVQFEGITQAACRQRALALGKIPHWVAGKCAEPG